jgi:hypothetical protein
VTKDAPTRYAIKARRPPGYARYVRPGIGAECVSGPWCPFDWHLEAIRHLTYKWTEFGEADETAIRRSLMAWGWTHHGLRELMDHLALHDGYEILAKEAGAWEAKSRWRLEELRRANEFAVALAAKRAGGRPKSDADSLCLRAHWLRVHEEWDIDEIAQELHSQEFKDEPTRARRKTSNEAYAGRRYCPECLKNPH